MFITALKCTSCDSLNVFLNNYKTITVHSNIGNIVNCLGFFSCRYIFFMHMNNQDLNSHSLKLWVIWAIAIILHLLSSSLLTFHILIKFSDPTVPIGTKHCRNDVSAVLYKKFLLSSIFTNLCSMFLSIVLAVLQSTSSDNPLVIFKLFLFLIQQNTWMLGKSCFWFAENLKIFSIETTSLDDFNFGCLLQRFLILSWSGGKHGSHGEILFLID